jgi:hypothetical protein
MWFSGYWPASSLVYQALEPWPETLAIEAQGDLLSRIMGDISPWKTSTYDELPAHRCTADYDNDCLDAFNSAHIFPGY